MQSWSKVQIKIMNNEVKNHKPKGVDPLLRQLFSHNYINIRLTPRSVIIQIYVIRAFSLKSFVSRLTKSKCLKSVTLIYCDNIPYFIIRKILVWMWSMEIVLVLVTWTINNSTDNRVSWKIISKNAMNENRCHLQYNRLSGLLLISLSKICSNFFLKRLKS